MYTTEQQQKLVDLRKALNEQMDDMQNSVSNEDQYNDAVDTFNITLREYRDILIAAYNKINYNI